MENKILFEAKGMKDDALISFAAIGMVLLLAFGIAAAASGGKIGAWYLYAFGMAVCIAVLIYSSKRHSILVKLIETKGNEVFLSVTGKANNIKIAVEDYSCWYTVTMRSAKQGGKEVKLHFKATGTSGEPLCLTQTLTPAIEPATWKQHTVKFSLGEKSFMVDDLVGLAKALGDHEIRMQTK